VRHCRAALLRAEYEHARAHRFRQCGGSTPTSASARRDSALPVSALRDSALRASGALRASVRARLSLPSSQFSFVVGSMIPSTQGSSCGRPAGFDLLRDQSSNSHFPIPPGRPAGLQGQACPPNVQEQGQIETASCRSRSRVLAQRSVLSKPNRNNLTFAFCRFVSAVKLPQ